VEPAKLNLLVQAEANENSTFKGKTMAWSVYMLLCEDHSVYVGVSTNVEARYAKHVVGKGAKYTRSHRPVKLLRTWDCTNHSEALKLEHYFKGLSHARKLYAVAYGLRSGIPKDVPLVDPH